MQIVFLKNPDDLNRMDFQLQIYIVLTIPPKNPANIFGIFPQKPPFML